VRGAVQIVVGAAALAACAAPGAAPPPARAGGPVVLAGATFRVVPAPEAGAPAALAVRRDGAALHYSEGLTARRAAEAWCGGPVRGTVDDRHDAPGVWVLRGGCA
jgi:hypothetical protein